MVKIEKQDVISRSSPKSEYRAMTLITYALLWVNNLLTEFDFEQKSYVHTFR